MEDPCRALSMGLEAPPGSPHASRQGQHWWPQWVPPEMCGHHLKCYLQLTHGGFSSHTATSPPKVNHEASTPPAALPAPYKRPYSGLSPCRTLAHKTLG